MIQQQNTLLQEKRLIVAMTPNERDIYLKKNQNTNNNTNKKQLLNFATRIQNIVRFELIFEFVYGSIEELNHKSIELADYLYAHNDDITDDYAIHIAISELVRNEIIKQIRDILAENNINDVRYLMIVLAQAISNSNLRYEYMSEHTIMLQKCYELTVDKFSHLSKNEFLRRYIAETSEPRESPAPKPRRFVFS